jgi:hypothetical protein
MTTYSMRMATGGCSASSISSLSDRVAAIRNLEPRPSISTLGAAEPGIIPRIPDAVEVSISARTSRRSEALAERLQDQGTSLDRPWARATALRCRGLLLADQG